GSSAHGAAKRGNASSPPARPLRGLSSRTTASWASHEIICPRRRLPSDPPVSFRWLAARCWPEACQACWGAAASSPASASAAAALPHWPSPGLRGLSCASPASLLTASSRRTHALLEAHHHSSVEHRPQVGRHACLPEPALLASSPRHGQALRSAQHDEHTLRVQPRLALSTQHRAGMW
ncbi:uncharacterized protein CC84DRAFT_1235089, partial [Paraphaeosphaeria sporulosa]